MKASEANLLEFLKSSPQFIIPIYQRTYSWTELEAKQLWNDILRAGHNTAIPAHFVGSIVYIEQGLYQVSTLKQLLVIDGQQRLTTVMLMLEALARHIGDGEPVSGFTARRIRNYYLLNPEEDGELGFKLLLTQTDKNTLLALLQQKTPPDEASVRVQENFELFQKLLAGLDDEGVAAFCKGLSKLIIVDVALSREHDNPQLIFESMNSTGRELSQADLIRNYVLMGLEPKHQEALYKNHWRPMELAFGQEAYGAHFDGFMRHYLTVVTGEIPRISDVYQAFKRHAETQAAAGVNVDALVAEVHEFANYYCAMALDQEKNPKLRAAFTNLRELRMDVAYPFLLSMYQDYKADALPIEDFVQAVTLVESYLFRRAVCSIPTNSLNKTFATITRNIKKGDQLEHLKAYLLLLPSYRRFPTDAEFRSELKTRDLYNFRNRSYWLRRLENHDRKEHVPVEEYTIEHILPQNQNLSRQWREDLGPNWREVQEEWLHTLGNLTLTAYNTEFSDRPFTEKRDMQGGFKDSPIRLNETLRHLEKWDAEAIQARAKVLADAATNVWRFPQLPQEALDKYRSDPESTEYTIRNFPRLTQNPDLFALYELFRKEVLALDATVTEEFLKHYIAFKAETNFVDVVPQQKRLRLALNMPFHELHDPRGIATDKTGVGRWGNGDVQAPLYSKDELPYVMGLIRQALEQQLGNGEDQ